MLFKEGKWWRFRKVTITPPSSFTEMQAAIYTGLNYNLTTKKMKLIKAANMVLGFILIFPILVITETLKNVFLFLHRVCAACSRILYYLAVGLAESYYK